MTAPLAVIEAALTAANALAERTLAQLADASARADRADARADDLRIRIDTLQHALDAAHTDARAAQNAADALRAAEAERKARGLLMRLRAAWRGE
jgi:chromosome condensin MukBEF ATPase and DNA-binding subunit MukB